MTDIKEETLLIETAANDEATVLALFSDLPRIRAVAKERQAALAPFSESEWDNADYIALRTLRNEADDELTAAETTIIESAVDSDAVFAAKVALYVHHHKKNESEVFEYSIPTSMSGMAMRIVRDLVGRGFRIPDRIEELAV